MALVETFDPVHKRVLIAVSNPMRERDVLECLRAIPTHPEFLDNYAVILNLLDVAPSTRTGEAGITRFIETLKKHPPVPNLAILSLHNQSAYSNLFFSTDATEAMGQTGAELPDIES